MTETHMAREIAEIPAHVGACLEQSAGKQNQLEVALRAHEPLANLVSFYVFIEALVRRRGLQPNTPRHRRKVTETL